MSETLDIKGAKTMSGTLVAGSEEDFDTICEFCHEDGNRVEAVGYCMECREYLCQECKTNHKKTSATRKHSIKDNLDMSVKNDSSKQAQGPSDATDPLTDRCQKHPEEFIKLFCNSHKQLGCPICISLHHRTCDDISYIRDVSSGITDSEELKNVLGDIKKLFAELKCSQSRSEWCQREANNSYNQMEADVKLFRQNINHLLDKLEENLLNKASLLKKKHLDSLSDQALKCDGLCDKLSEMNSDLENKLRQKHNNQSFISMKSAKENITDLENEAHGISQTIRPQRFLFTRDDKLDNIISSMTSLGTLSLLGQSEYVKAKYVHDINIKSNTDMHDCYIYDAVLVPDGRLALSDYQNQSVKLVDVANRVILEEVSLTTEPRALTLIEDDHLAVTLKDKKCIQLLSLSPTLSASRTIAMPGCYSGITYWEKKLTLVCYNPGVSVHICDMSGNLLQKIDTDDMGKNIFSGSALIQNSPDQTRIYVSEHKSNKIICVNKGGVVMTTYVSDRLELPSGIAMDDNGCVYVCSRNTHTVHQLSPSGQFIQIILEKKDGIYFPFAIAHSAGVLYISSVSKNPALRNNIKVYELE